MEASPPEVAANAAICLIHQANYLLDRQLQQVLRSKPVNNFELSRFQ